MRILFVHNALRSFVRVDRDILSSVHELDEVDLSIPSRVATLPSRLARTDLVYAWFAGLHSLGPVVAAVILRRPSVVVVGGYDTANEPEIGYGHMAHPVKRHMVRLICGAATALVANSRTAAEEVRRNTGTGTPVHMLYHGFAPPALPFCAERDPVVLTVGNVRRSNLERKGHAAFIRAARLVPEARFILAGRHDDDTAARLGAQATDNVQITGYLPQPKLDELFARASVYIQASVHEGFGCALAEAMAAGCMPVVTRRGALPEVAGECGLYVDNPNPDCIARAVRRGLAASASERRAVAQRIANRFSLEGRRRSLLDLVRSLDGNRAAEVRGTPAW